VRFAAVRFVAVVFVVRFRGAFAAGLSIYS
jgi:hypothetical protein